MPRRSEPKATNRDGHLRVRWAGKEYRLGRYDDPASWRRFEELKEDILRGPGGRLTVLDLVAQYFEHVKTYYRHPNGEPTPERDSIRSILDKLLALFKGHAADEFGPVELKQFRKSLIDAGRCRTSINKEIGRVVRMFKWGVAESLIAPEAWHRLAAVEPLPQGRSAAPEMPPVESVDDDTIAATLRYLTPAVQALVQFQRHTGCRPDEACRLRMVDVDRSDTVWIYSPTCPDTGKPRHKTAWRNKPRHIAIGPELQRILEPWIQGDPKEYCFSPAKTMKWFRLQQRAASSNPHKKKSKAKRNAKKKPGRRYNARSYAGAIAEAVKRAQADWHPPLAGPPIHWSPNQIRHLVATELERDRGLIEAQKFLGHAKPDTTRGYVDEDVERIKRIALERSR